MKTSSRAGLTLSQWTHPERHSSELSSQLIQAQEQERSRIAEEVHDEALQSMIATAIQLELLATRLQDAQHLALVEAAARSAGMAIGQLRALLVELSPPSPGSGGLVGSLREYIRRYEGLEGPVVHLDASLEHEPSPAEAAVLFRIAREALANTHKHAKAHTVTVAVSERGRGLELVVADDGVGFDLDGLTDLPGHLGLASIAERARAAGGWVVIDARPGLGTEVRAWIPRFGS